MHVLKTEKQNKELAIGYSWFIFVVFTQLLGCKSV